MNCRLFEDFKQVLVALLRESAVDFYACSWAHWKRARVVWMQIASVLFMA